MLMMMRYTFIDRNVTPKVYTLKYGIVLNVQCNLTQQWILSKAEEAFNEK